MRTCFWGLAFIRLWLLHFLKNMLIWYPPFFPAVISLPASHPGIDLWNMPRCASKVTLHVYAIDHALRERRDYSAHVVLVTSNAWSFSVPTDGNTSRSCSWSVWLTDSLHRSPSSETLSSLSDSFIFCSFQTFGAFPAVSLWLCCCPVGYSDHFFLLPLDRLSGWMCSHFLYCFSFFHPPISTRQPSGTEIREEKPLCRQKAKP